MITLIRRAADGGKKTEADAVNRVIGEILARPEHKWASTAKTPKP